MKKVELLPTRDCEAGYRPGNTIIFKCDKPTCASLIIIVPGAYDVECC